jgi:hypothetical protein
LAENAAEPRRVDGRKHLVAVDLRHPSACLAGQHQLAHLVAGMAGKEGIAALEAVHDAGATSASIAR